MTTNNHAFEGLIHFQSVVLDVGALFCLLCALSLPLSLRCAL